MTEVLQPLNERVAEVVIKNADLLESHSMEPLLLQLVAHVSAYRVIIKRSCPLVCQSICQSMRLLKSHPMKASSFAASRPLVTCPPTARHGPFVCQSICLSVFQHVCPVAHVSHYRVIIRRHGLFVCQSVDLSVYQSIRLLQSHSMPIWLCRWEEGHIEEWSQISFPDQLLPWAEVCTIT